jgi:hypothetical protein
VPVDERGMYALAHCNAGHIDAMLAAGFQVHTGYIATDDIPMVILHCSHRAPGLDAEGQAYLMTDDDAEGE